VKAQLARARAKLARIAHLKTIRRRSRTVSEHWAWDEASRAFGISTLPEEAK